MLNHDYEILLLILSISLAFYVVGKLSSIERKLDRLLPSSSIEGYAIDDDVRALINAGKINSAVAMYAKRSKLPLLDAERAIKGMATAKPGAPEK